MVLILPIYNRMKPNRTKIMSPQRKTKREDPNSAERAAASGKTVKLSSELLRVAEQEADLAQRSIPRQLEYWALLGRAVEPFLKKDDCHALMAELKVINSLTLADAFPAADSVMAELEDSRSTGVLTASVTSAEVVYEIDDSRENGMIKILSDGTEIKGILMDGQFVEQPEG